MIVFIGPEAESLHYIFGKEGHWLFCGLFARGTEKTVGVA